MTLIKTIAYSMASGKGVIRLIVYMQVFMSVDAS